MPASAADVKRVCAANHARTGSAKQYENIASHLDADDTPIIACALEGLRLRDVESIPRAAILLLSNNRLVADYSLPGVGVTIEHADLESIASVSGIAKSRFTITFDDGSTWEPRLFPALQFLHRAPGLKLHGILKGLSSHSPGGRSS